MDLLSNHGISKKNLYKQRKLLLYISSKERSGFENCLNLPNKKLRQAMTKLRISGHKFPIKRFFPLCCDGIGDEIHMFSETTLLCLKNQEAFEKESLKPHFCII